MNSLNTLLPVNEQLNMLKGRGTFIIFAKVQYQHNAGGKHCYTIRRSSQFKIKSFSKAVM